jgi:hypothetical protein
MWALAGAAFSVRAFQSWWMHSPPLGPQAEALEVIPSDFYDSVLGALFLVVVMGTILGPLWLSAVATGTAYLRRNRPPRSWCRAWAYTVTAAALISLGFLGCFFYSPPPLFGDIVIGHADWVLLGFSAAFLIVGGMMIVIIRAMHSYALAADSV